MQPWRSPIGSQKTRLRRSARFFAGGAIQPVGNLEELLVEKLAFVALRLGRVHKADVKVALLLFDAIGKSLTENHSFAGGLI